MLRTRTTPNPLMSTYHTYKRLTLATGAWLYTTVYDTYYNLGGQKTIIDEQWVKDPSKPKRTWREPLQFRNLEIDQVYDTYCWDNSKVTFQVDYWTTYRYYYTYAVGYCVPFASPVAPVLQDVPESLIGAAFRDLEPNYKSMYKIDGINIYTMILELADVKKMFSKTAFAFTKTTRDIPEKWLMSNFGIAPFFGDLTALYNLITKLNDCIDRWNYGALNGVTFNIHSNISGLPPFSAAENPEVPANEHPYGFMHYHTTGSSSQYSGKVHLYFKPKYITEEDRAEIVKTTLGLDRPFVGVWEAVPFSWAVDYFLHIGDIISAWDEAIPSLFKYEFVSAGYSLRSETQGYLIDRIVPKPSTTWRNPICSVSQLTRYANKKRYIRKTVGYQEMLDFMSRPPDYQLGWDKGWRQASYLASVTYLLTRKR